MIRQGYIFFFMNETSITSSLKIRKMNSGSISRIKMPKRDIKETIKISMIEQNKIEADVYKKLEKKIKKAKKCC